MTSKPPPSDYWVSVLAREADGERPLDRWYVWIHELTDTGQRSVLGPFPIQNKAPFSSNLLLVDTGIEALGYVRIREWQETRRGWVAWVGIDVPKLAACLVFELEYELEMAP